MEIDAWLVGRSLSAQLRNLAGSKVADTTGQEEELTAIMTT